MYHNYSVTNVNILGTQPFQQCPLGPAGRVEGAAEWTLGLLPISVEMFWIHMPRSLRCVSYCISTAINKMPCLSPQNTKWGKSQMPGDSVHKWTRKTAYLDWPFHLCDFRLITNLIGPQWTQSISQGIFLISYVIFIQSRKISPLNMYF